MNRLPLFLLLAILPACGTRSACFSTGDGGCLEAGSDAPTDAGPIVSYAIRPENLALDVQDGVPASLQLSLIGLHADGSSEPVPSATFALADETLGTLAGSTFTANATRAGSVRVTASTMTPDVAHADLTVRLHLVVNGDVPPDVIAHFTSAPVDDPMHASDVRYPLEGSVMPANVAAPDVQWEIGRYGDAYRVRFSKPDVSVEAYVLHTGDAFRYDYTPSPHAWSLLRETDPAEVITVQVDRWDALQSHVVPGPPVSFRVVGSAAFGAVYYWQVPPVDSAADSPNMAVMRGDTSGTPVHALVPRPPSPPDYPRPTDPTSVVYCVGCHAVSRDGRSLSAVMGSQLNLQFDLTDDLSADPAPTISPVRPVFDQVLWYLSSWNESGTRLVVNQYQPGGRSNGLALVDPRTGDLVPSTGLPGFPATSPDWSPDGNAIAYILHGDDSEDGATAGDLGLIARTGNDAFGNNRVIHQGGDLALSPERGEADSHTDWSPDARFIAFQHGPKSTLRDGTPGAIYVIPAAGGAVSRLNTAMGGPASTDAYAPGFAPVRAGELYWLAFYSRRDYGNAQAGTRGTHRPQVWVTALDANFTPGSDPSHPAFWLPGQDTTRENLDPSWAPLACRSAAEACTSDTQCCSGNCSTGVCAAPMQCRARGDSCGTDSDCCTGLTCSPAHACDTAGVSP